MSDWDTFNTVTKNLSPRAFVLEAISYTQERERALDLGCGAMRDMPAIAEAGFKRIDAVDSNPSVEHIAEEKTRNGVPLTFYPVSFSDFDFQRNGYDFISTQYALPFNPPETFDEVFGRLADSLKIGGVFTGQFFGREDGWVNNSEMTFHTEFNINELLKNFDIHVLREEKKKGKTALGKDKFWHVFHAIATRLR